jgi:hypothetical protein
MTFYCPLEPDQVFSSFFSPLTFKIEPQKINVSAYPGHSRCKQCFKAHVDVHNIEEKFRLMRRASTKVFRKLMTAEIVRIPGVQHQRGQRTCVEWVDWFERCLRLEANHFNVGFSSSSPWTASLDRNVLPRTSACPNWAQALPHTCGGWHRVV